MALPEAWLSWYPRSPAGFRKPITSCGRSVSIS